MMRKPALCTEVLKYYKRRTSSIEFGKILHSIFHSDQPFTIQSPSGPQAPQAHVTGVIEFFTTSFLLLTRFILHRGTRHIRISPSMIKGQRP